MIIIAIDPHVTKYYAYSLWIDGNLEDFGSFKTMNEFGVIMQEAPDEVLIEDQFLAKNYNTSKSLTYNAGKVAGLCEFMDTECTQINVATWKAKIPELQQFDKKKELSHYQRNKAKKNIMIEKAQEVVNRFGLDVHLVDEDIASAVLIAWTMRIKDGTR